LIQENDRVAYHSLSYVMQDKTLENHYMVWKKEVSLKVSLLSCRLLLNQLPIKDNSIHRGNIPQSLGKCASGYDQSESAYHLFVGCAFYGSIWMHNWL
jgi:hypothetical protein